MKDFLYAYLLFAGVETEPVRATPLESVQPGLADRCNTLADQPTFDFPISRELGVKVGYVFKPIEQSRERVFTFTMTR